MTSEITTRYCAREFSAQDIQAIRDVMTQNPGLKRTPLSRRLCELLHWVKPDGELKDMTCRVAMLRMQTDGLITLPPSQMPGGRGRLHFPATAATDAPPPVVQPVHEPAPLSLRVVTDTTTSRLWNEYIQSATTTWATPRCRAASCATTSLPVIGSSPCSASAPAPASSPRARPSSAGIKPSDTTICNASSTTPAS